LLLLLLVVFVVDDGVVVATCDLKEKGLERERETQVELR
jgi:hypothetical protein